MKTNTFFFLRLLLSAISFWIVAFCLFVMIRYYAFATEFGQIVNFDNDIPISQWLEFGIWIGILVGFFYAIVEFLFEKLHLNKLSIGLVLIEKSLIYLLVLIFSTDFIMNLIEHRIDRNLPNESGWWKTSKMFWLVVGYFILSSLIFSFIKIANEKFGKGVFFNFLIGKYRKPREEKRLFMFLDLQASTTIAEQIGHYKYSELIQDCFYDLNQIVTKYNAEIYQYVGDEAVLCWHYKSGLKNNNCVNLFFHFQNRLLKKQKVYLKKYGLVPKFKAGLHGGKLIVTEVGSVKKEIAYHGDVINTTARIQDECNKYGEWLLASEELIQDLDLVPSFQQKFIGNIVLKGKEEASKIYAIHKI